LNLADFGGMAQRLVQTLQARLQKSVCVENALWDKAFSR
jgi:hypothetical protein